jgi:N-acetylglutamate synthase
VDLDALFGQRVSLRHRIGERDGRPLYSDAVGELVQDGDALTVYARRGPVRVERAAVVAVRAVPPAPPRRASLTAVVRLEGLCADAWPAQVQELLGDWRLRAAGGYTARANSALAVGSPGVPVPAALDVVREFAARHGIGPRVHVPVGSPWDRAVADQGWVLDIGHEAGAEVAVLVGELGALRLAPTPRLARTETPTRGVEVPLRPADAWWRVGGGGTPSAAQRHVLDPGGTPVTAFALVRDPDGAAIGRLRATVVEDHLHLSQLDVVPAARRGGHATALLAAAAAWGEDQGARWGVLQVALQNTGARAMYERLGFVEHHRYRYLVPPPS